MADPVKFHPAEFITEELEARGWSLASLASMTGIGLPMWEPLLARKCTLRKLHAVGLSRAFGTSVEMWLDIQRQFDAAQGVSRG